MQTPDELREKGIMTRTEKQKMLAGDLYNAGAPELQADMAAAHDWLARYNAALGTSISERRERLLERLAAVGEGAVIRPPFHCDYGFNITLGAGVFLNFNCVILDVVEVTIGDKTQIGPGVQILTADHPRDAAGRASGLEFGRPIHIGRNVWIGGGPIILPGVTIGDDALIGAGSVVTRDLPVSAMAGRPAWPRRTVASCCRSRSSWWWRATASMCSTNRCCSASWRRAARSAMACGPRNASRSNSLTPRATSRSISSTRLTGSPITASSSSAAYAEAFVDQKPHDTAIVSSRRRPRRTGC
jgi:maltose O-acetyltransferase